MIPEVSTMLVTAIAMTAILVHRYLEIVKGSPRIAVVADIRAKADPILAEIHHTAGNFFSYLTLHNFVVLCNWLFVCAVRLCMLASKRVHDISAHIVHKASQKTEDLSRSGAASFYLKQIKEGKEAATTASLHR